MGIKPGQQDKKYIRHGQISLGYSNWIEGEENKKRRGGTK